MQFLLPLLITITSICLENDVSHIWSISILVCTKYVHQTKCVGLCLDLPSCCKSCRRFLFDNGLTSADSIEEAVNLQVELKTLFGKGGFLLHKWNSSELSIIQCIDPKLLDQQSVCTISEPDTYTKTLEVEWNAK